MLDIVFVKVNNEMIETKGNARKDKETVWSEYTIVESHYNRMTFGSIRKLFMSEKPRHIQHTKQLNICETETAELKMKNNRIHYIDTLESKWLICL